ncbi:MAG TPA: nuclease-related domain-containing protein [Chloroflexia bacterium]|nr:nuclease-related domain-containing protein [Chloroflexia bacterium]
MDTLTLAAFLFVLGVAGAGMWLVRRARRAPTMTTPAPAPAVLPVRPPAPSPAPPPLATDPASPFQEPLALVAANLAARATPADQKTRPAVFAMRIAGAALAHPAPPPGIPPAATAPPPPLNASGPRVVLGSTYLQTNRMRHLSSFQVGKDGEDRIAARIGDLLDAQWYMFRNVVLPDRKGDIDIVLVGPGGIWALEVKAFTGNYRVANGRWYKETSNGRQARHLYGPGKQVRDNATRLCTFLKDNGITRGSFVEPAVVLAEDHPIDVVSSGTDIWLLNALDTKLANLKVTKKLSPSQVETIAAILTRATQAGALLN